MDLHRGRVPPRPSGDPSIPIGNTSRLLDLYRSNVTSWRTAPRPADDPSIPVGSTCRLLALPPELRDLIFELAVTRECPIDMRPDQWGVGDGTSEIQLQQPALAATCNQIRREALVLFYSLNTFLYVFAIGGSVDDGKSLATYLDAVGVEMCKCLKSVLILFVFRVYPTPKSIMPWIELFNRDSPCMPPPGVLHFVYSQDIPGGFKSPQFEWVDDLMKDLEAFGWHLREEGQQRPKYKTSKCIRTEMYQWLVRVGNGEYKGFMSSLEHEILHHYGCVCIPEERLI